MKQRPATCSCGSGDVYAECCGPFHDGLLPENALQLMRSRYTAYAMNLPDYIIKTTHPKNPCYVANHRQWAEQISEFSLHTQFEKLEILDSSENGNTATVTFVAHMSQNGQDITRTEKSDFEKVEGKWLYRSGQVTAGHKVK